MIEIFAVVICMTIHDPKWASLSRCYVAEKLGHFQTKDDCERMRLKFLPFWNEQDRKSNGGMTTDLACYKKEVRPEWQPAE
jgi:hypothetical protein